VGSTNGQAGPRGPSSGAPDFNAIAETLGVDADLLVQTLKDAGGRDADLSDVARKFGITVDALQSAMPSPGR
jgi:hypothetical protein